MATSDRIPTQVLSEHFQERMKGHRLVHGVFLTFTYDAAFFEQQVLPVFLDLPVSHVSGVRLVQLEDALRTLRGRIEVYYDSNGLEAGSDGSARLDVQRVPVRMTEGLFHPKNVFLLVEQVDPAPDGSHRQELLVACLSANLTEAGWWVNVETAHVETLAAGEPTRMRDDLVALLDRLVGRLPRRGGRTLEDEHPALAAIRAFIRSSEQRVHRSNAGRLHPHFYGGRQSLPDFLAEMVGDELVGLNLEVLSPYFDDADDSAPLAELIARFAPREVRVLLPRAPDGRAPCRPTLYEAVKKMATWGQLPGDVRRLGRSEDAAERRVHAKVYRFFGQNPKRELLVVGSANLTRAAHGAHGNEESALLVEVDTPRRPEFWLEPERGKPSGFAVEKEEGKAASTRGTPLAVTYHWDHGTAEAYWNESKAPPTLYLEAQGEPIAVLRELSPRTWCPLDAEANKRLATVLLGTSFITVRPEGGEGCVALVQEDGMSHKPSLLLALSPADILRYWALLTPEQRLTFLETCGTLHGLAGLGADLVTEVTARHDTESIFTRFAGFFHAFSCLEKGIRNALDGDNPREAACRLFGQKYDSLGQLLDSVLEDDAAKNAIRDPIDRYVIYLCAGQMVDQVRRDFGEFFRDHAEDARRLDERLARVESLRATLVAAGEPGFGEFVEWFEQRFRRRAKSQEVAS